MKKQLSNPQFIFLKMFSRMKPEELKLLTPLLRRKEIDLLCTFCRNVLFSKNGLNLSKSRITRIRKLTSPERKSYLTLANQNASEKSKRRIISQKGKGIGTLIAFALPFLISALTKKRK